MVEDIAENLSRISKLGYKMGTISPKTLDIRLDRLESRLERIEEKLNEVMHRVERVNEYVESIYKKM